MTRRKILIVEDEVLVRCGLRSMVNWEKLGLDVIGDASNGKEALEIYEKEKPDIVMTDIKMPVMDGLELIEKIREQDQSTRIVLLTCYEEFSYLMRAMKLGVSDYILKLKMKPDEIEKAMEKVCKELEPIPKMKQKQCRINQIYSGSMFFITRLMKILFGNS